MSLSKHILSDNTRQYKDNAIKGDHIALKDDQRKSIAKQLRKFNKEIESTLKYYWNEDDYDLDLDCYLPVNGKRCYKNNWQKTSDSKGKVSTDIINGNATGYGIKPNYRFVFLDCDSNNASNFVLNASDDPEDKNIIENTVIQTSGKQGKQTMMFVITPYAYEQLTKLATSKLVVKQEGGNLEVMFGEQHYVVGVGSYHPDTGKPYYAINSASDYEFKPIPDDLVDAIVDNADKGKSKGKSNNTTSTKDKQGSSEYDKVINELFDKLEGVANTYDYISNYFDCAEYGEWQQHGQDKLAGIDPVNGKGETGSAFQIVVEPSNEKYGAWYNHATEDGGGLIQFIQSITGNNFMDAVKYLKYFAEENGINVSGLDDNYYHDQSNHDLVTYACTEWLKDNEYITVNNEFYQYTGLGYWKHIEQQEVRTEISHFLFKCYQWEEAGKDEDGNPLFEKKYKFFTSANTKKCMETAIDYLSYKKYLPQNDHLMSFNNGTFNIKTFELQEHNKEDYLFSHSPYHFDINDNYPKQFLAFLTEAIGTEQIKYIQAFIQALLDRTAPYGKFLHLIGESGCGKGTLLKVLASLFNPENVTGEVGVSILNSPDKRHQFLNNKRFYYATDVAGFISNVQAFYSLVENEQLSGRKLHSSDTYTQKWDCWFALASVDYLQIENSGAGWSRRVLPIEFNPRQGKKDVYLESKLKEEIPQIIAWAFQLSPEERDNILHGELEQNQRESIKEQEAQSDPITAFINDCIKPDSEFDPDNSDAEPVIYNNELWANYQAYCKATGKQAGGYQRFINKLKRELGRYVRKRHSRKNLPQAFKGIYFASCFKENNQGYIECDLSKIFHSNFDEPEPVDENAKTIHSNKENRKRKEDFETKLTNCTKKKELTTIQDEIIGAYEEGKLTEKQYKLLTDKADKMIDEFKSKRKGFG